MSAPNRSGWLPILQAATRTVWSLWTDAAFESSGRMGEHRHHRRSQLISAFERLALEAQRNGRN